jgi:hypothetical protein
MRLLECVLFLILIIILALLFFMNEMNEMNEMKVGGSGDNSETSLGNAMYQHSRTITPLRYIPETRLASQSHLNSQLRSQSATGGRESFAGKASLTKTEKPKLKQKKTYWTDCDSWKELEKNDALWKQYSEVRCKVLDYPKFDWSNVMKEMLPKLQDNREYIGTINLENDGVTLKVERYEASPTTMNDESDGFTFASVPVKLVQKYAEKPALLIMIMHVNYQVRPICLLLFLSARQAGLRPAL